MDRSCNQTGLWQDYDEDIEKACQDLEDRHYTVYHYSAEMAYQKKGLFKNIFCFICNMDMYPTYGTCEAGEHDNIYKVPVRVEPPFSVLLGFGRRRRFHSPKLYISSFTFSKCSDQQWSSPDGQCLPLHCSAGKSLNNGTCTTSMNQIRGLGYRIDLWFHMNRSNFNFVQESANTFITFHNIFVEQVTEMIQPHVEAVDLKFGAALRLSSNDTSVSFNQTVALPFVFWVQGHIAANANMTRDLFEAQILDVLTNNVRMKYFHFETDFISHTIWAENDVTDFCLQQGIECNIIKKESNMTRDLSIFKNTGLFLNLNKVLHCPCVYFNSEFYEIDHTYDENFLPQNIVSLKLGETKLTFSELRESNELLVGDHQVLNVCKDLLESKLRSLDEERRRDFYSRKFRAEADDITHAQYYLTLVCIGASLVCLLLALLTYFRFSLLRSGAGMNNIFLCGSLLLAQASLLASAHVSGPQTLCTVLGMSTHFLWLWMFVWSFICCFRMFRVFTAKTRQEKSVRTQRSRFIWTVTFSLLVPAVIVSTVVTASHIKSDGDRTGYGHESCYLDSSLLIGVATALPLALVTASNIAFFAVTVAKINKVKKMQSHDFTKNEERRNLYIYIKLSTMAGIFWFLAILTNGLQGVFIFLSFIWNNRVLNLYLVSFGMTPVPSSDNQRGINRSSLQKRASQAHKHKQESNSTEEIKNVSIPSGSNKRCIADIEHVVATFTHDKEVGEK
ncbi:G-protein coupled receptor mth2 [Plakobranchus ocellatus]|uniref:G-protein coupled receptor mth2 n=1 Tax=Plakobranchus ocellatus TaxID=259542 RepID=A0AAV3ZMI4_9GAST|nr:G-protein coupled receptor mth2 [Plakobranchus ocellatus]